MKASTILLAILLAASPASFGDEPDSDIGYATYEEALADLKDNPDADVSVQEGWTKISLAAERTIWWFTPESHAAHPALAKVVVGLRDGWLQMDVNILCTANKDDCDLMTSQVQGWMQGIADQFGSGPQPAQE